MTILATDTFVRANNADLGTAWDECTGDSAGGFDISGNLAVPVSPGLQDDSETNNSATWPNDQYAEVTLSTTAAEGIGGGSGPICRAATGATVTRYRLVGNASGYEFARFVLGAFTSLSSGSGTTFASGDRLRLEVRTAGANCDWILKKNGTTFASGSDTSPIASGRAGIGFSGGSGFTGPAISGFEAGDFLSAVVAPMMPTAIWGRNKMQLARPHVDSSTAQLNNYLLAAAIGVYTYAGSAASTLATRLLAAATGVYNLTGAAALLAFGHKLLANAGAYVLTGSAASILATRLLAATKGTFTLTGAAAATLYKRILIAGTGAFTLTGAAISVARTYVLGATRGVFSLAGQAASTIYSAASASVADWIVRLRRRRR